MLICFLLLILSAGVGRTGTLIAIFNLTLLIYKYIDEMKTEYANCKIFKLKRNKNNSLIY